MVTTNLWKNLKAATRKTSPLSFGERIKKLQAIQRGWINYFRMASLTGKLKELDGGLRNRLLVRLGVDSDHAYAWSRTRMGGWAVARSPILVTTITLKRFGKRGYESMPDYYLKVSPSDIEPPYMRPAWPALSEAEGYGGMRGAPHRLQAVRPSTRLYNVFNY